MNRLAKTTTITCTLAAAAALAGCASITPTYETREAYVVIDGEGVPSAARTEKMLNDITSAVRGQMSAVRAARNIPPSPLPKEPGQFSIADPAAGRALGTILQASAMSTRLPHCDNPVMTLQSDDSALAQYGDRSRIFVCVMPYAKGFRTAIYGSHMKASGGFSVGTMGGTIGSLLVGDGSQFIPRVMDEVKKTLEQNLTGVHVVQSYIPESFRGPMVDKRDGLQAAQGH